MAKKLITIEEINIFLSKISNTKVISKTIKSSTEKLQLICGDCGDIFETSWHKILTQNKIRCNKCSRKIRDNNDRKKKELEIISKIEKDGNKLLSKYVNNNSVIKIQCSCGNVFETTWSSYNNSRNKKNKCNNCSQHYKFYEDLVASILKNKNILFYREKKFDNLINKRNLKFDFFLEDYNCCIEVDEKYHYSKKGIEECSISNSMKSNYCRENAIKLVRISYKCTREEINKIIEDIVSTYVKA